MLILADDLGYADLSVTGSKRVQTPHIDRLAEEGVRFTEGYANSSICAPTRAALMTGRYPQRTGYVGFTGPLAIQRDTDRGLGTDEVLLPEPLRAAGYVTGAIGKWHLGVNQKYRPGRRGFDEFFGFLPGGHSYVQWTEPRNGPIFRDDVPVEGKSYLTHAFSDEAVSFIERHQARPFFLYLAYSAVHFPFQVREKYKQRVAPQAAEDDFPTTQAATRETCLGMGLAMDEGIGRILAKLEQLGLADDTMVVFLNDNGGVAEVSDNRPFRGSKISLYEGGIRVPFFIRYPRMIAAGTRFEEVASGMDLFPTIAGLAGAELPAGLDLDGVDLLPFLTGERQGSPHPEHFWALGDSSAVRRGDLKLLLMRHGRQELYDLGQDLAETTNLAEQRPVEVQELAGLIHAWQAEMPPPAWTKQDDAAWMAAQEAKAGQVEDGG